MDHSETAYSGVEYNSLYALLLGPLCRAFSENGIIRPLSADACLAGGSAQKICALVQKELEYTHARVNAQIASASLHAGAGRAATI